MGMIEGDPAVVLGRCCEAGNEARPEEGPCPPVLGCPYRQQPCQRDEEREGDIGQGEVRLADMLRVNRQGERREECDGCAPSKGGAGRRSIP